jgi:hypothetical protein
MSGPDAPLGPQAPVSASGHALPTSMSRPDAVPAHEALPSPRPPMDAAARPRLDLSGRDGAARTRPTANAATPARTIMIIRHAEKPAGKGSGIDAAGRPDTHSLTPRGWSRANGIANLFDAEGGPSRPGLARPKAIFAAGANDQGEGTRTRQTVGSLASKLGVPVNSSFGKGDEVALARQAIAASKNGPVLISWQHGEIPAIAKAFNTVGPTPPTSWPDNRYDMVWTLTDTGRGWKFSQVPEMVLSGDSGQTFR